MIRTRNAAHSSPNATQLHDSRKRERNSRSTCGFSTRYLVFLTVFFIAIFVWTVIRMQSLQKPLKNFKVATDEELKAMLDESIDLDNLPAPRGASAGITRIAVVVLCFNRPEYLRRTLNSLFSIWPKHVIGDVVFELFISQDADNSKVTEVIEEFAQTINLIHLRFLYDEKTWQSGRDRFNPKFSVYYRISAHFYFVLNTVFDKEGYSNLVFLEDDMLLAPDFFLYFARMASVLIEDLSVMCVSAWNDNGQAALVADSEELLRTDVFPGLGWMLSANLWTELKPKWPSGFWDDWLREPNQHQGRSCVFPEINRVYTFGEKGSSGGEFFARFLKPIKLNTKQVDWSQKDISFVFKSQYESHLISRITSALPLAATRIHSLRAHENEPVQDYRLTYDNEKSFKEVAQTLNIMTDFRAEKPRASYRGVVQVRYRGARLLFIPSTFNTEFSDDSLQLDE